MISADGLVLWTGGDSLTAAADYLLLSVEDGLLHFAFNLGNGEGRLVYNSTRVDDGKWHRVRATRTEQTASLKVDNGHVLTGASPGKLRQLNGNGRVYVGGVEDPEQLPVRGGHGRSMVGCVSGDLNKNPIFFIGQISKYFFPFSPRSLYRRRLQRGPAAGGGGGGQRGGLREGVQMKKTEIPPPTIRQQQHQEEPHQ